MEAKKDTKKAEGDARTKAFKGLYQTLATKEGETRDLEQVKCIKDDKRKVLVQEIDIKDKWKNYFHKLFNDG